MQFAIFARRAVLRLRVQFLINKLAPENRRRLLCWRQVASDQVFVDLRKFGRLEVDDDRRPVPMLHNPISRACYIEGHAGVQFATVARDQAELLMSVLVKEFDATTFAVGVKKSGYQFRIIDQVGLQQGMCI